MSGTIPSDLQPTLGAERHSRTRRRCIEPAGPVRPCFGRALGTTRCLPQWLLYAPNKFEPFGEYPDTVAELILSRLRNSLIGYAMLDFLRNNAFWMIAIAPALIALVWHIYELVILPALISRKDIRELATTLILLQKDHAERYAYELELQAWKDSETAEQGKWRRVRREIKRRNR